LALFYWYGFLLVLPYSSSRAAAHLLTQLGYQAFALEDCANLFAQARWRALLDDHFNYVLRDGLAYKGQ